VSVSLPTEFHWSTDGAANGASGERLADNLIDLVNRLQHVRTICDLGCGNGYITGRLGRLGYEVTGVDASITGLEIASQNHPSVRFLRANIDSNLPECIGGQTFDLVMSNDVIEHLYRPADLLEAAARLMTRRAHFIVCTPYHGYVKNLALSIAGKMDKHFSALHDGGHIKFFSVNTLSQLMTAYGFHNLSFSFYGRAPWLWKNMICRSSIGD
jgi:2-polyprenyl-3-methyl-5-hydroxy-6-metoxy-1,4-benzoquinol methylase